MFTKYMKKVWGGQINGKKWFMVVCMVVVGGIIDMFMFRTDGDDK